MRLNGVMDVKPMNRKTSNTPVFLSPAKFCTCNSISHINLEVGIQENQSPSAKYVYLNKSF